MGIQTQGSHSSADHSKPTVNSDPLLWVEKHHFFYIFYIHFSLDLLGVQKPPFTMYLILNLELTDFTA